MSNTQNAMQTKAPLKTKALFVLLGLAALVPQAQAQTTNLYDALSGGAGLKYYAPTYSQGARLVDTTSTVDTNSADDFWVYCLDPQTTFAWGAQYTVISGLDNWLINVAGGRTQTYAKELYTSAAYTADPYDPLNTNRYGEDTTPTTVRNELIDLYSHAYADSLTSDLKSAAFQYAVWEIVGEKTAGVTGNPYSRTTGFWTNNKDDAGFKNQVDLYLSALFNNTWSSLGLGTVTNYTYTVYSAVGASQTMLGVTPGGTTPPTPPTVPEPGTLALAALAGGLAWQLRRKGNISPAETA